MLTIINLLNARYEELTGGKKLPALNPNKILPGLMAAKAAGQAVPSAPSIGPSAAVGPVGSSAARSTSGSTAPVQEHKNLLKNAIKLLIEEMTEEQAPENFNFEYLKKELKSRDWQKNGKQLITQKINFKSLEKDLVE